MKLRALLLIAVAALAFVWGSRVTPPPVTTSRLQRQVVPASQDSAITDEVDEFGNDVNNAVAQYALDPAGSVYELHAPQVELPRLASPQS